MRALLYTFLILVSCASVAPRPEDRAWAPPEGSNISANWSTGYYQGYKDGSCYRCDRCVSPAVPEIPPEVPGCNNPYMGGYNKGFLDGLEKRSCAGGN
jgi:hypothetical protein